MSSALSSILSAMAGWSPTYDSDVTIGCRNVSQLSDTFSESDAPKRMLFLDNPHQGSLVTLGKTMGMTWRITDRLYLKPAAHGDSLKENSNNIALYIASYVDTVRQNRAPTAQSSIESIEIEPLVVYWPPDAREGGMAFFGVDVTLDVFEAF